MDYNNMYPNLGFDPNPNFNFVPNPNFNPNKRGGGRGGFNRGGRRGGNWGWRGNQQNFRGSHPQRGHNRGDGNSRGFRGGNRHHEDNRNVNKQWQKRPRRETPGKRLSEIAIGVTEYISSHKGFNGIIKSRYSDFQVSEINEQGNIAKLTDLTPPTPPAEEEVDEDEELLFTKYNLEILPMETWDRINKLSVSTEVINEIVELDATTMSKEMRTKIHDAVKKAFGETIVSSTLNIGEKKSLRFEKYRKGVRIDNRVKWVWPGEHVYFIVHKENCDTMEAATRIADRLRLHIKPSMLGYAGTKDRRAKTSQWFSLRKVDPRKIAASCKDLRDVRVGNFEFRDKNLKLGMLKGNQFRIALRNVTASDEAAAEACAQLQTNGFINYYGLQRFGSRVDTPTYEVGLKLLQGKFQEAIDGILEVREGPLQNALRAYKESGAAAALRIWPHKMFHSALEARLLRALASCPTDLLGALNKLARNTRLLYLHAYQSLVWNRCVSMRLRRHGHGPAVGDLVPMDTDKHEEICKLEEEDEDDDEEDSESRESDASSQNGDQNKMADKPEPYLESSIKQTKKIIPVKILTQEDVDSGKYSLFDIILPLPGNSIEYPPNIKDYYEELLKEDGLSLEMKNKFKSYSMTGAYRHVAIRPLDVSWRCVRYSEPYADLILSDWDLMQNTTNSGIVDDGKYKALLLTMVLPASCYATMALRELLRVDTSCDTQASQNDYHKTPEQKKKEAEERKAEEEAEEQAEEEKKDEIKAEIKKEAGESENGEKKSEVTEKESEVEQKESGSGEKRKIDDDVAEVEVKKLKQEVE